MTKQHIVEKQNLPHNYGWQPEYGTKPFDTLEEAEAHIAKRIEEIGDSRHPDNIAFRVTIIYTK